MLKFIRKTRVFYAALSLLALASVAFAVEPQQSRIHLHSAIRFRGESFNQAFQRYQKRIVQFGGRPRRFDGAPTASQAAVPFESLAHDRIPNWNLDANRALQAFRTIRDLRFIQDGAHPGFVRRSTWMYPDDGCFARAALMVMNLEQLKIVSPAKIFIFGDLTVKTVNSPNGDVSWWYHVAPIVRVAQQEFVLDPAISPERPLPLNDWIRTMRANGDLSGTKFAICQSHSYVPSDACYGTAKDDARAMVDQQSYLPLEWERLEELKRNPGRELGDFPPWLATRPSGFRRF